MVLFITSKSAYEEMKVLIHTGNHATWLASGILSNDEIEKLWELDLDISVLDYVVDTSDEKDLECAMSTIREHHPGKNIWAQYLN
ncbi:hypothetical protein [Reinekea sp. G2M2-21]|uniref:hypothetical protein n=1 Tax=Reinekea sp. G2M2-21 TaxID=2788942 RepID=UPI0018AC7420|nr:hypothetical protein [Reinekea sp. G2M2-21]